MGEYILVDGGPRKLGTLESLFYVRYQTLRELVDGGRATQDAPANLPPADYLDPAHGWRYRFPFPDEDGNEFHDDSDRGFEVLAPPALVTLFDHHQAHATIQAKGKGRPWGRLGVTVPCPQAALQAGDFGELQIVAQKQVDGRLWTVVRCPYCGAMGRLPVDEAHQLADYNAGNADPALQEVMRRMLAGYEEPPAALREGAQFRLVHMRERDEDGGAE